MSKGHPIHIIEADAAQIGEHASAVGQIFDAKVSGIIVRGAFDDTLRHTSVANLNSDALKAQWAAPNAGMTGGEIRVIGDAATPTFTALRGPTVERYEANAKRHGQRAEAVFGDADIATKAVAALLTQLTGLPAAPPKFAGDTDWAPYNFRALDPGEQIFSHHDDHYGLAVYEKMDPELDRSTILSWFVTLEAPESGGELVVYGLWGSDPNPPVLPSRFLDTAALEAGYHKHVCGLRAGDLIVFDAGRHVHRVTPIEGDRARLTFGGFLSLDKARTRVAFWS